MYRNESIELVYCTARLLGKNIGPCKAVNIVAAFSHDELVRIYRAAKTRVLNGGK